MRVLFKAEYSDHTIKELKAYGKLPAGVQVKTDECTGRRYFNYVFRMSTDVDWDKIQPHVEALGNMVTSHADLVPEGIYEDEDGVKAIVILKRSPVSGITWDEIEFHGTTAAGVTPQKISAALGRFREGKFKLVTKWSSGVPA